MLLLSMFVRPKVGYVRWKIGLTGAIREIICSPGLPRKFIQRSLKLVYKKNYQESYPNIVKKAMACFNVIGDVSLLRKGVGNELEKNDNKSIHCGIQTWNTRNVLKFFFF